MPSKLRTPSPPNLLYKNERVDADVHRLDPDGDVSLVLTRFVEYEDEEPRSVEEHQSTSDDSESSSNPMTPISSMINSQNDNCPCEEEVILRVSSRHLILASPVFRAMLQRKFNESNTLRKTGRVEIPLPDDDPDAFLILLNIIHGRVRKVPLVVDLNMLTQLAILVDKYEIHECVEMFTNFWFNNLKPTIPKIYTTDIPCWICICWVLNRATEFKNMTQLVLRQSREPLPLGDLPIPSSIVDTINNRRHEVLDKIGTTLLDHLNDYLENEHCSFECDALMVGALTKRLRTLRILPPHKANPPYSGLNFEDFTYRFRDGMYFPAAQRTSTSYYGHSKCAIRSVDKMLSKCEERLGGLELADYKLIS